MVGWRLVAGSGGAWTATCATAKEGRPLHRLGGRAINICHLEQIAQKATGLLLRVEGNAALADGLQVFVVQTDAMSGFYLGGIKTLCSQALLVGAIVVGA